MAVPYYFGQQAIAERLGYKSKNMVIRLIQREGLPCYVRRQRNASGRGAHQAYTISESAITAWELSKGAQTVQKVRARAELKKLKKMGQVA